MSRTVLNWSGAYPSVRCEWHGTERGSVCLALRCCRGCRGWLRWLGWLSWLGWCGWRGWCEWWVRRSRRGWRVQRGRRRPRRGCGRLRSPSSMTTAGLWSNWHAHVSCGWIGSGGGIWHVHISRGWIGSGTGIRHAHVSRGRGSQMHRHNCRTERSARGMHVSRHHVRGVDVGAPFFQNAGCLRRLVRPQQRGDVDIFA